MKRIMTVALCVMMSTTAYAAERFVVVTHDNGVSNFWSPIIKGAQDAGKAVGAEVQYVPNPSGDMAQLGKLIETAAAGKPDGIVATLPDPDTEGLAIKAAIASGIPVITINSGETDSKKLGALMHIGQPELNAGRAAGERAKKEGATKAICLNHETTNTNMADRCKGYFEGLGQPLNMIDSSNDPIQVKTRVSAALQSDQSVNALIALDPSVCEAAAAAVTEVGAKVTLSCFDLSPAIIRLIKEKKVSFTIDQQPYLQGYLPVILLHLYNTFGLRPGSNVPSGPGIVDATNVDLVQKLAGVAR